MSSYFASSSHQPLQHAEVFLQTVAYVVLCRSFQSIEEGVFNGEAHEVAKFLLEDEEIELASLS